MLKHWSLAAVVVLALSACSGGGEANQFNAVDNVSANAQAGAETVTIADGLKALDESRFRAAVDAAGLTPTLAGPGEYTVLVPVNQAFERLPGGAFDRLMQPSAREQLTTVITYHVLPGTILAADLGEAIDRGQGKALLATMNGQTLTATREGDAVVLTDAAGSKARLGTSDARFKNGVVHLIDAVLMPTEG